MAACCGTGTPVGRKYSGRSSLRIEPRREEAWALAPGVSPADEGQQGSHHGTTNAAQRNNAGGQTAPPARSARPGPPFTVIVPSIVILNTITNILCAGLPAGAAGLTLAPHAPTLASVVHSSSVVNVVQNQFWPKWTVLANFSLGAAFGGTQNQQQNTPLET